MRPYKIVVTAEIEVEAPSAAKADLIAKEFVKVIGQHSGSTRDKNDKNTWRHCLRVQSVEFRKPIPQRSLAEVYGTETIDGVEHIRPWGCFNRKPDFPCYYHTQVKHRLDPRCRGCRHTIPAIRHKGRTPAHETERMPLKMAEIW